MKKLIGFLCLFIIGAMLASCAPIAAPPPICTPQGLKYLQAQLDGIGGQFVELGDQVIVTMPSYYFFAGDSNNITPTAAVLLERVAGRLNCYPTQAVAVTSYVGGFCCSKAKVALARQRAKLMGDVLRTFGVSRLVYENSVSIVEKASCEQNRIELTTTKMV